MSLAYRATADFAKLNHPMRVPLSAEIHSRPFLQLQAPESLTHFALYVQQDQPSQQYHRSTQHQILQQLCTHYGVAVPHPQARYFFHDFGRFRLKWECHTEFATYTFVERADPALDLRQSFERMPLQHVPAGMAGRPVWKNHRRLARPAAQGRRRQRRRASHQRAVSG